MHPSIKPSEISEEILACAQVGLVPIFVGSPGTSKSYSVKKFADDHDLKLIDIRLGQCTPEDLNGLPMRDGNRAIFAPFNLFPLETDEIPDGYAGWLVFFDEITSANKSVQAAAYKVILDRMVSTHNLHPNTIMVAAGNKATDRAVVNQMSTALQSRMVQYEVEICTKEFSEHALRADFDYRVRSFLDYMPSRVMFFKPDHQEKTFPCPRTWEFLSKLIKDNPITPRMFPRIAGCIGAGTATEFMTFVQEFDRIPSYEDIIRNPQGTKIPSESSTKYATVSTLVEKFDKEAKVDFKNVLAYLERFSTEFQILYMRALVTRHPELINTNIDFKAFARERARYLTAA